MIKVVFISNFLNHHQLPFCKEMIAMKVDFTFVATEDIPSERKQLGYIDMNKKYDFVLTTYDNSNNVKNAIKISNEADIAIIGSAPTLFIKDRLKANKLTFRYNERILKEGIRKLMNPKNFYYYFVNNTIYRNKNFYLLAASAYAPYDFSLIFSYPKKMIKWGYFIENANNNLDKLLEIKKKNKIVKIIWCGRLIPLKHPELVIMLADFLKKKNYKFEINVVGSGEMLNLLKQTAIANNVDNCINFVGSVPSNDVCKYMNEANIFIFTSDFNEGWGAVLNEAMNSACAIVASHSIGSVPFLLKNNYNGFIYENGNVLSFLDKVEKLMLNENLRLFLGKNAYNYIKENYSAKEAAKRLIYLYNNDMDLSLIKDGVCSVAPVVSNKKMVDICK